MHPKIDQLAAEEKSETLRKIKPITISSNPTSKFNISIVLFIFNKHTHHHNMRDRLNKNCNLYILE